MNEKVFKRMGFSGVTGIVAGIVIIAVGIATGVLLIISGAGLLKDKSKIMI